MSNRATKGFKYSRTGNFYWRILDTFFRVRIYPCIGNTWQAMLVDRDTDAEHLLPKRYPTFTHAVNAAQTKARDLQVRPEQRSLSLQEGAR